MHVPFHLNREEVKANARAAYKAGRLGFQNIDKHGIPACYYRYPNGSCCAIGASFTDEQAERFDKSLGGSAVAVLMGVRKVLSDDASFLIDLQEAHDELYFAVRKNSNDLENRRRRFLKLIGIGA